MRPAGRQRVPDLRRDGEQLHRREEDRVAEGRDLGAAARAARRGRSSTEPIASMASVARTHERQPRDEAPVVVPPNAAAAPNSSRITRTECRRSRRTGSLAPDARAGCDPDRRRARSSSACGRRTRGSLAVRVGGGEHDARARRTTGRGRRASPRGAGDDYVFVARRRGAGPIRARASSPRACAGRRASSTPARFEIAPGPGARASTSS